MESRKTILVAIDFSPCSAAAFREAKRLAVWLGTSVKAIHVVTPIPPIVPDPIGIGSLAFTVPTEGQLVALARRRWPAFAEACGGSGGASFTVDIGSPRERILDAVRLEQPRMLLIGAFGTAEAHLGIGTTAAACAQRAATQVMVVREREEGPFRAVVACIDFSDASRVALDEAISIATEDEAALHILHVYTDPWHGLGPTDDVRRNMPDFGELYQRAAERRLREFCGPMTHELVALKPTFHAVQAPRHADGINDFIGTHGCDLAVLGTRGKFNLRDYFWGSTAERVVREARCSVLAVKTLVPADRTGILSFADAAATQSVSQG